MNGDLLRKDIEGVVLNRVLAVQERAGVLMIVPLFRWIRRRGKWMVEPTTIMEVAE